LGKLVIKILLNDISTFLVLLIMFIVSLLIPGSVVDIADKKFQIFEGEPKKTKRKLPQTPGVTASTRAPPKPKRSGDDKDETKAQVKFFRICKISNFH